MEYTILIRKSIVLWILLGIVECQDSPNYIFTPSSPAQGRFVPSFGNTRTSSFLSGSRNSLTTSASSFPDQLIFISNDGPSAPQSPQLTTGFAQFPQHLPLQQTTRNPDYYDISPRPFGVPTGSQSFSRPKALRPNNSGTGFGSLSTQQTRTNVPHQQTQFLAHFNEQNIPSSSAAASNFQINRINGGGRPFSSISGSTNSAFSKNRPFTSNTFNRQQQNKQPTNFNDEMVTPVQQQLPFRNTRTRFLPVSSKSSTAASTTITTSKPLRYNRFGSGRSPSTDNRQSTTTVSPRARQPAASVNKTLFQPRRPVIISREINRPFGIGGGRITIKHNGSDKNISSNVNEQEDDDIDESEEDIVVEEIREQNHVNKSEPKEKVFEKFSLHEAGASIPISSSEKPQLSSSGAMPPTVPTSEKGQDDHTVILTSNFYLPGSFEDDEEQVDGDDGVEAEGEPTSKEIEEDQDISVTTQQPTDYDYEYDEVDTTIAPQLENASNYSSDFVTEIEPEVETKLEEFSVQGPKSVIGKLVTETPSPTEITTLPQESSAEYDENEEYEDGTGSGAGLVGSVDYLEGNTEKIPVNQVVGREVVSVVTTKSVINGSTAVPQSITPSTTTVREEQIISENTLASAKESSEVESESEAEEPQEESAEEQNVNNTTESYVVIASIQTSRSINGARFLPFPAIEQEETKQTLSELERKIHGKSSRKKVNQSYNESNETVSSNELQVDAYPINTTIPGIAERLLTVHETTTQATSSTTASRFAPNIRKFMPKTSPKPKINIDDIPMDDITSLLPAGFKPRPSYKHKKINKLTSTTTESIHSEEDSKPLRNSTISRSYKTSLNTAQDLTSAGLPPKGYRTTHASSSTTETYPRKLEDVLRKIKFVESTDKLLPTDYNEKITTPKTIIPIVDDISKFLPPGFKLPIPTTTNKPIIKIQDEITKFLPPGFKPAVEDKPELKISIVDDLSKLLPPGFKLESAPKEEPIDISKIIPKDFQPTQKKEDKANIFKKIELKDESGILPSGLTENSSVETTQIPFSTTTASSSFKVVFPKGLNKRPGHRLTTPKAGSSESNVATSTPIVIKKGPPMRITTEFTGWPTPSTTPISIEKLLEQSRTSTIDISELLPQSSTTSTSTTTTTTTTPEPPKPTKPGHCRSDCDLAGTIKIIDGVAWKPELLDHNTVEWKNLAREVEAQLNEVYSNAPRLSRWYKKVRIDSFSKGSVLVDYFVELANITQDVNTLEIKKMFHQALTQPPLPVVPLQAEVDNETDSDGGKDFKDNKGEKLVKETYLMGRFVVDPTSTDFIVIPKSLSPTVEFAEDDALIPHWAIVLIVIGIGSLCFVIIFGVTVLLNRQKRAKKTPIPLTADMMNDLKVNHMGGTDNYGVDDFYNIDDAWNDTKQPIKPKRFTNSMHGSSGSNIYDSWRSTRHGDYYYDSHNYTPHAKSEQYPPDAFADVHQMYTYNQPRSRYQRDYDPDF